LHRRSWCSSKSSFLPCTKTTPRDHRVHEGVVPGRVWWRRSPRFLSGTGTSRVAPRPSGDNHPLAHGMVIATRACDSGDSPPPQPVVQGQRRLCGRKRLFGIVPISRTSLREMATVASDDAAIPAGPPCVRWSLLFAPSLSRKPTIGRSAHDGTVLRVAWLSHRKRRQSREPLPMLSSASGSLVRT